MQRFEIFTFSFKTNGHFSNSDTEFPNAMFRWQQVGADGAGGAKSTAIYLDGPISPIPELSNFALYFGFLFLGFVLYRKLNLIN